MTYSFSNLNDPHGGLGSGSVAYKLGVATPQAWFNQVVSLQPNTRYTFSGWTNASVAHPGCVVYYYIGSADGSQVLKIMTQVNNHTLGTTWVQSTGFYDTDSTTLYTFNVRTTCAGALGQSYYFDDLVLTAS